MNLCCLAYDLTNVCVCSLFAKHSQAVAQLTQKINRQEVKHAEVEASENGGGGDTPTGASSARHQRAHSTASSASGDGVVQATTKAASSFLNIFSARSSNPPTAVTPSRGGPLEPTVVKLPQVPERMRNTTNPTDRERVETEIISTTRLLALLFTCWPLRCSA